MRETTEEYCFEFLYSSFFKDKNFDILNSESQLLKIKIEVTPEIWTSEL